MERDQPHNDDKKHGMGKGFHGLKSKRSPGRWPTGSVVSLVGPAIKAWTMKQAMGDVKETILEN